MSENSSSMKKKERFPALDDRFGAVCISTFIGPTIFMLLFAIVNFIPNLFIQPAKAAVYLVDQISLVLAFPAAHLSLGMAIFVIGLIGLLFTARRTVISLQSVLITTFICLSPLVYFGAITLTSVSTTTLVSGLMTAAICWRITKNWHSPEPTP